MLNDSFQMFDRKHINISLTLVSESHVVLYIFCILCYPCLCINKTRLFNKLFKIQKENNNNDRTNQHINEIFLESKKKSLNSKWTKNS